MTSASDLGWAGGFFDGEGCIHVKNTKHGNIVIQVSQREREPLERLRRIVGVGNIYRIKPNGKGRKGFHVFAVSNVGDILHFTSTLIPFTSVKRNELILGRQVASFGRYSINPERRETANRLMKYQTLIRR